MNFIFVENICHQFHIRSKYCHKFQVYGKKLPWIQVKITMKFIFVEKYCHEFHIYGKISPRIRSSSLFVAIFIMIFIFVAKNATNFIFMTKYTTNPMFMVKKCHEFFIRGKICEVCNGLCDKYILVVKFVTKRFFVAIFVTKNVGCKFRSWLATNYFLVTNFITDLRRTIFVAIFDH